MADKKKFIIGSRGSKLSLAYSSYVKNLLIKFNPQLNDDSVAVSYTHLTLPTILLV